MPRPVAPLLCPICAEPLSGEGDRRGDYASLRCPSNHAFDVAREGYVNLVGGRPPKHPGDTREQVLSRRAFMDAGHYQPVFEFLADLAVAHITGADDSTQTALDVGCGEGYFTESLDLALRTARPPVSWDVFGLDVSKDAIRLAAGRYPDQRYIVADVNKGLPFLTESIDLLVNIFAPRPSATLSRVIRVGGILIIVIPRTEHLLTLRESYGLLGIEPDKSTVINGQFEAVGFELLADETLTFTMRLDGESLANWLTMTPNYHHLSPVQIDAARTVQSMDAAAVVGALILRRRV